jgi:hypothetical protein
MNLKYEDFIKTGSYSFLTIKTRLARFSVNLSGI